MSRVRFQVRHGDSLRVMPTLRGDFDAVIADPPYGLSGQGSTCKGGKRASVSKGDWDRKTDFEAEMRRDEAWIRLALDRLRRPGSLAVCASKHNLPSILAVLAKLQVRIQNIIVWQKPAPPPNLGCRCFTHSHESVVWATVGKGYYFAYAELKAVNSGKQMKDIWRFNAAGGDEVRLGRHPTQKPLGLMERLVQAICPPGGRVLDPFCGAGSTGVAVKKLGADRQFVGIEQDSHWVDVARTRIRAA